MRHAERCHSVVAVCRKTWCRHRNTTARCQWPRLRTYKRGLFILAFIGQNAPLQVQAQVTVGVYAAGAAGVLGDARSGQNASTSWVGGRIRASRGSTAVLHRSRHAVMIGYASTSVTSRIGSSTHPALNASMKVSSTGWPAGRLNGSVTTC